MHSLWSPLTASMSAVLPTWSGMSQDTIDNTEPIASFRSAATACTQAAHSHKSEGDPALPCTPVESGAVRAIRQLV